MAYKRMVHPSRCYRRLQGYMECVGRGLRRRRRREDAVRGSVAVWSLSREEKVGEWIEK